MEFLKSLPKWAIAIALLYVAILVSYAVYDNRRLDFWPPTIHPKSVNTEQSANKSEQQSHIEKALREAVNRVRELEYRVKQYETVLDCLASIDNQEVAILDELAKRSGKMPLFELESAMEDRGLSAGLGGRLTGMRGCQIIEGDSVAEVFLTDFGKSVVRIRRAFQKALQ